MSIESEFAQVILEMHLLATGSTQRLDGRVTGTKERPILPAGEHSPLWEEFEARWATAGPRGRREVLYEAKRALHRYKHQARPEVIEPGSIHWKREIANRTDVSDDELCRVYSISRVTLWRYRRDYRVKEAA